MWNHPVIGNTNLRTEYKFLEGFSACAQYLYNVRTMVISSSIGKENSQNLFTAHQIKKLKWVFLIYSNDVNIIRQNIGKK